MGGLTAAAVEKSAGLRGIPIAPPAIGTVPKIVRVLDSTTQTRIGALVFRHARVKKNRVSVPEIKGSNLAESKHDEAGYGLRGSCREDRRKCDLGLELEQRDVVVQTNDLAIE